MSYTVVIDESERERRFENRINATVRHCRIGRVMRKMMLHGGAVVTPREWYPDPIDLSKISRSPDKRLDFGAFGTGPAFI